MHEFNTILHEIKNIISNPNGMNDFLRLTFILPQRLSRILNFTNVFFIIDHFDDIDLDVKPVSPFSTQNESKINVKQRSVKKETKMYHMIDYVDTLLMNDFIVSCRNEENFMSLFDTFNLRIQTEFVSVVGLVEHSSCLKEVKLEMKDGSTIVLLSEYLSGCCAFISKWEEVSEKNI